MPTWDEYQAVRSRFVAVVAAGEEQGGGLFTDPRWVEAYWEISRFAQAIEDNDTIEDTEELRNLVDLLTEALLTEADAAAELALRQQVLTGLFPPLLTLARMRPDVTPPVKCCEVDCCTDCDDDCCDRPLCEQVSCEEQCPSSWDKPTVGLVRAFADDGCQDDCCRPEPGESIEINGQEYPLSQGDEED